MIDAVVKNFLTIDQVPSEEQLVKYVGNKLNNAFIDSLKNH
ncbi:hypothetical protein [Neobacillus terrae]|nr:hypothetical protein [Neobacillus terrae]